MTPNSCRQGRAQWAGDPKLLRVQWVGDPNLLSARWVGDPNLLQAGESTVPLACQQSHSLLSTVSRSTGVPARSTQSAACPQMLGHTCSSSTAQPVWHSALHAPLSLGQAQHGPTAGLWGANAAGCASDSEGCDMPATVCMPAICACKAMPCYTAIEDCNP